MGVHVLEREETCSHGQVTEMIDYNSGSNPTNCEI